MPFEVETASLALTYGERWRTWFARQRGGDPDEAAAAANHYMADADHIVIPAA